MSANPETTNFIRQIIDADLASGKNTEVVTRFPPEPNGYLHIGHAKSIWLNFGIAADYGGKCVLRYDDTNPTKEEQQYVTAIEQDVRWLGYTPTSVAHASDYFERLYEYALELIDKGLAYVDSQTPEQLRQTRGTLTEAGQDSPDRGRSIADNRALFTRMRAGEFADGELVLRAKIDMASPNMNLRDPSLYRIRHTQHQRTANEWCIYPMYDFAHGLSDAIEGVTHSLCTLEFEDHRALYDWFIDNLSCRSRPYQYEFARMQLSYTLMSKRMLTQLVEHHDVQGWDDPRLPTLSALRRRGFTPASVRHFIGLVGITKKTNVIDVGILENSIRQELDPIAPRALAVVKPLKVTLLNYPPEQHETIEVANHPADPSLGHRSLSLSREIYIDRDDFMLEPPRKFFRLSPGQSVRLRYAFVIKCVEVLKDAAGEVVELHCEYAPQTRAGQQPDDRKVKGIIHWVDARTALDAELRLYNRLFTVSDPLADKSRAWRDFLNPDSLGIHAGKVEASLADQPLETRYQFERVGYFYPDQDSQPGQLVFNRIVTLRDSWGKHQAKA